MEQIIEMGLDLSIEPLPNLLRELDVDAFLKRDYSGVVVDIECFMEERFQNRFRFSLAHEIGHLVLHRNLFDEYPISSIEEWKFFITEIPEEQYKFIEYQANEFAGRLLIPRNALMKEIEECLGLIEDPRLIEFLRKDPAAVLSRISPKIGKVFGVSDEVIQRRAEREEFWPGCVQISKTGKANLAKENQSDRR
jgi:Zn-dependent peptidase ImmA (M78 family)